MYEEELDNLYHHGIKGQKWGIRRYQNPDGTLTEEGKKRLEAYREKEISDVEKRYKSDKIKTYTKSIIGLQSMKKRRETMKKLADDKMKEIKYLKALDYAGMRKEQQAVGKAFLKNLGGIVVGDLAGYGIRKGMENSIKNYINKKPTGLPESSTALVVTDFTRDYTPKTSKARIAGNIAKTAVVDIASAASSTYLSEDKIKRKYRMSQINKKK